MKISNFLRDDRNLVGFRNITLSCALSVLGSSSREEVLVVKVGGLLPLLHSLLRPLCLWHQDRCESHGVAHGCEEQMLEMGERQTHLHKGETEVF